MNLRRCITFLLAGSLLALVACFNTQNPFSVPSNARINETSFPDDSLLQVHGEYPCNVRIDLYHLIDSIYISQVRGETRILMAQAPVDTGFIPFLISPEDTGAFTIEVAIVRTDGTRDSISRSFSASIGPATRLLTAHSFRPALDIVGIYDTIACSVVVLLPHLVQNFEIIEYHENIVTSLATGTGLDLQGAAITFDFIPSDTGRYRIVCRTVSLSGTIDSVDQIATVISDLPIASPEAGRISIGAGDTAVVEFSAVDPGNDLVEYITWIGDGIQIERNRFYADQTGGGLFSRHVAAHGVDTIIVGAQVKDRDSMYSAAVFCTVVVIDSVEPLVSLISPADTAAEIQKLPVDVICAVTDHSPVHSAYLDGQPMLVYGDTALATVSILEKGTTRHTIDITDKAGNSTMLNFPLTYSGIPTYPPKIKPLSRTVAEGGSFDTLFLDTLVIINKSADYTTDSLEWIITDSTDKNVLKYIQRNEPEPQRFFVPDIPGPEWSGILRANFRVTAPGGLSDVRPALFTVTAVADPPQITLGNQWKPAGTPFDTLFLDTCVKDPDTPPYHLSWRFIRGTYYMVDSIMRYGGKTIEPIPLKKQEHPAHKQAIPGISTFTRRIAVVPDTTRIHPDSAVVDTLTFIVSDRSNPPLSVKKKIVFTKGRKFTLPSAPTVRKQLQRF